MRIRFPEYIYKEYDALSPYLMVDIKKNITIPKPGAPEDIARRFKAIQKEARKYDPRYSNQV